MSTPPSPAGTLRLGVVGVGLIGGSVARSARGRGVASQIFGADLSEAHLREATQLGLIDAALSPRELCERCDLVVVAVPPRRVPDLVYELEPALAAGAVMTDVASVKGTVIEGLAGRLRPGHRFVPGHPVAGTERSGPSAAVPDLFAGRWCLLTPMTDGDADALERVRTFWLHLGAQVADMDAATHDRLMASVSHLPHAVAWALVRAVGKHGADALPYAAGGLRDYTRIAVSDPGLWSDIMTLNREALGAAVSAMREALDEVDALCRSGDRAALDRWIAEVRSVADAGPK